MTQPVPRCPPVYIVVRPAPSTWAFGVRSATTLLRGVVGDRLDDQHVALCVDPVGHRPVDDAPGTRAVGQVEDVAEPWLVNRIRRPIAAEDLRRVELADPAFPHAPHDPAHI